MVWADYLRSFEASRGQRRILVRAPVFKCSESFPFEMSDANLQATWSGKRLHFAFDGERIGIAELENHTSIVTKLDIVLARP